MLLLKGPILWKIAKVYLEEGFYMEKGRTDVGELTENEVQDGPGN
jgi:hypothetical protein